MNWVDLVVIGVVVVSGLAAFARGLVHEVLAIGAWIGAGFFAVWAAPFVGDRFLHWFGPDFGKMAALGAMFVVALVVLSVLSSIVGGLLRMSALGTVDRTLGVVFGLVRGVVLIAFAYIVAGWVVAPDRWPPPVLDARTLPYAYEAARVGVNLLPREFRPVVAIPPSLPETRVDDLLRALPLGKAIARP